MSQITNKHNARPASRVMVSLLSRIMPKGAFTIATAVALAVSLCASAKDAWADQSAVPLFATTPSTRAEFSALLAKSLSPEFKKMIQERKLVVVASAWEFTHDGRFTCVAELGLSHATPKGRNPRTPAMYNSWAVAAAQERCVEQSIQDAVKSFSSAEPQTLLKDIEKTTNAGSQQASMRADKSTIYVSRDYTTEYNPQPIFDLVHAYRMGEAVDYRHVATYVKTKRVHLDQQLLCWAEAGFAARPSEDRKARIPAVLKAHAVAGTLGGEAACEQKAALGATTALMKQPWLGKVGSFTDFKLTREDGVPLPDLKQVAAVEKRLVAATTARSQAQVSSAPSSPSQALKPRCINPATGLPMMDPNGGCLGFDVGGNVFGSRR